MSADLIPAGIETMNIDALRKAWGDLVGTEAPKLRQRELMALALAYRLQARSEGDLPGPMKRRAAELARRFQADPAYTPVQAPALMVGSAIIKEWRGVRHEVRVVEDGYTYCGQRFGSLSEVAQHITGTKWNGNVFFGLKARTR